MTHPVLSRDRPGQMVAVLLGCAGIGILVFGFRFYEAQRKEIEQTARDSLAAVAELKVAQIHHWRQEIVRDATWVFEGSTLAGDVRELVSDPAAPEVRHRVNDWLGAWQNCHSFSRVLLVDLNGEVLLAAPAAPSSVGPRSLEFVARAIKERKVLFSDLHPSATKPETLDMGVFVPLLERRGVGPRDSLVGVLVFEIDPAAFLFPLIEHWPTPSQTAETLLIRRDGEQVVYLNELRHRKGTALKLAFPMTDRTIAAVRAVLGEEGVVAGMDYRGKPVLAALGRIPDSPWYIVAKQDVAEVFAPLRKTAWITGLSVVAMLLAVLLGFALLWRRRDRRFVAQELAERRASEARLRSSEAMLNETGRIARIGGWSIDLSSGTLTWTREVYSINGVGAGFRPTVEAALGLFSPESRPTIEQAVERAMRNGQSFDLELELIAADGKRRWVQAIGRTVFEDGVAKAVAGTVQDISDRKRAEQEREALMRDLERVNTELEGMVYVASHDLRSPLVNLQGFGRRLEKACRDLSAALQSPDVPPALRATTARIVDERIPGALKYVRISTERMDSLVGGLLKVSRIGTAELSLQPLDMARLVGEAVAVQAFRIQEADAEVQVGPLPSCKGDGALLSQVFSNLLDNALKYRDPARPLRIRIWGRIDGGRVVYAVEDNGLGIAPEHQGRIWELFHRLHPEGGAGGEGLGLSIVRRIAERHRGRAWVESTAGRGSCFSVSIPKD